MSRVSLKTRVKNAILGAGGPGTGGKSDEKVFVRGDFEELAGYDQVGRALRTLVKEGFLLNIGYGLYVRAETDPVSGKPFLPDDPETIKQRIREKLGGDSLDNAGFSRSVFIPENRPTHLIPGDPTERLSVRLGLEFPYDWSNRSMSENSLIRKVIEKGRFNDLMRVAFFYGLPRLRATARSIHGDAIPFRIANMLTNIELGFIESRASA